MSGYISEHTDRFHNYRDPRYVNRKGTDLHLPRNLAVNGSVVAPSLFYLGGASTGSWIAEYGVTLSEAGAGASPIYGVRTPYEGAPLGVGFQGAKYLQAGDTTPGDIGIDDFAFRLIWQYPGDATYPREVSNFGFGVGWELFGTATSLTVRVDDGTQNDTVVTGMVVGTWYDLWIFANRDEASNNCLKVYRNAVEAGEDDISARSGNISSAVALTVGATPTGTKPALSNIALLAMWHSAAWFQAGAAGPTEWLALAKSEHDRLRGR
jgi:hypothetical protein